MAKIRKKQKPKTWSMLGDVRRKPSEYEVTTAKFHYHFRKEPAPFELDPEIPLNVWYLKYREGSTFQAEDWEEFRDPARHNYRSYVKAQEKRETYLDNVIDEYESKDHDANVTKEWSKVLERILLTARFPIHGLQMIGLYVAQMAPAAFITNPSYFQSADEMRRVSRIAYRAKSLSLSHEESFANTDITRQRWEDDEVWQPMREVIEKLLIAYDWGEAFAGLNLVVKPVFDAVINDQIAEAARDNDDELGALMSNDFALDSLRSKEWSSALVKYAIAQNPDNKKVLEDHIEKWTPMAYEGAKAIAAVLGKDIDEVRAKHKAFLTECGLALS